MGGSGPGFFDLIAAQQAIRQRLVQDAPVQQLAAQRIWLGLTPASGYHPVQKPGNTLTGPGIVILLQAGRPNSTAVLLHAPLYLRSYGADYATVWAVDDAVAAALEGQSLYPVVSIRCSASAHLDHDPETDWPLVVRMFRVIIACRTKQ